jgi:hypothetical protein
MATGQAANGQILRGCSWAQDISIAGAKGRISSNQSMSLSIFSTNPTSTYVTDSDAIKLASSRGAGELPAWRERKK